MSRSKKDILETERMLERLAELLAKHVDLNHGPHACRVDAEALRRISMTLHHWHELECGDSNSHGSWAIVRGRKEATWSYICTQCGHKGTGQGNDCDECHDTAPLRKKEMAFVHDDDGTPFMEHHHYRHGRGEDYVTHTALPDREAGARKRLARIMARYPQLQAYVQGDPRGCALYILRPGDVPQNDQRLDVYYSRGLAVFQ